MKIVKDSKQQLPLLANNEFKEISTALENLHKQFNEEKRICNTKSKKLLKFTKLPIYKEIIKIENISQIICSDNLIGIKN
jgi:hypothetical protein